MARGVGPVGPAPRGEPAAPAECGVSLGLAGEHPQGLGRAVHLEEQARPGPGRGAGRVEAEEAVGPDDARAPGAGPERGLLGVRAQLGDGDAVAGGLGEDRREDPEHVRAVGGGRGSRPRPSGQAERGPPGPAHRHQGGAPAGRPRAPDHARPRERAKPRPRGLVPASEVSPGDGIGGHGPKRRKAPEQSHVARLEDHPLTLSSWSRHCLPMIRQAGPGRQRAAGGAARRSGVRPRPVPFFLSNPMRPRALIVVAGVLLVVSAPGALGDAYAPPPGYYDGTVGLTGAALDAALRAAVGGHAVRSYDQARADLAVTDRDWAFPPAQGGPVRRHQHPPRLLGRVGRLLAERGMGRRDRVEPRARLAGLAGGGAAGRGARLLGPAPPEGGEPVGELFAEQQLLRRRRRRRAGGAGAARAPHGRHLGAARRGQGVGGEGALLHGDPLRRLGGQHDGPGAGGGASGERLGEPAADGEAERAAALEPPPSPGGVGAAAQPDRLRGVPGEQEPVRGLPRVRGRDLRGSARPRDPPHVALPALLPRRAGGRGRVGGPRRPGRGRHGQPPGVRARRGPPEGRPLRAAPPAGSCGGPGPPRVPSAARPRAFVALLRRRGGGGPLRPMGWRGQPRGGRGRGGRHGRDGDGGVLLRPGRSLRPPAGEQVGSPLGARRTNRPVNCLGRLL